MDGFGLCLPPIDRLCDFFFLSGAFCHFAVADWFRLSFSISDVCAGAFDGVGALFRVDVVESPFYFRVLVCSVFSRAASVAGICLAGRVFAFVGRVDGCFVQVLLQGGDAVAFVRWMRSIKKGKRGWPSFLFVGCGV